MLVLIEAYPNGAQRLDDLVMDRSDLGAGWIRRKTSPGAHRPLFCAPAHSGRSIEDPAVGVFPDSEHHLQGIVTGVCGCPDLLRPGWVRLTDSRECVNDLVGEELILGHQISIVSGQQCFSPFRYRRRSSTVTSSCAAGAHRHTIKRRHIRAALVLSHPGAKPVG